MIHYLERKLEGTIREDNGAQIRTGAKVLAKFEVAPEHLWLYDIDKFTAAPPPETLKLASQSQVLRYARGDQSGREVCSVLASGYPVVFGFSVFEEFEADECPETGILLDPKLSDDFWVLYSVEDGDEVDGE